MALAAFAEFRREVWLMSGLVHPNLVVLKGICTEPLCILMEFMNHGDLYQFIHHSRDDQGPGGDDAASPPAGDALPRFGWSLMVKLALDVALGMRFLHNITPPITHRDLKSPNILLSLLADPGTAVAADGSNVMAKVADFGLSRDLGLARRNLGLARR